MKNMHHHLSALTSLSVFCLTALTTVGQGAFQNMDFESAVVTGFPVGYPLPVENALPGWNAYYDGVKTSSIWHNTGSLGSSVIAINDAEFVYGFVPLDGKYSVVLEGRGGSASIGQTGMVPSDSLSVVFYLRNEWAAGLEVSFQGHVLPYNVIGSETNYDICRADISQFAGQTGELRFTEYAGGAVIDDIQFSTQAVPEPCTVVLSVFGALMFFSGCRAKNQIKPQ
jgi:hypothetical protein